MSRVTVSRTISRPVAEVFGVITDIEKLPESNPDVVRVEFLSEQRSGHGTRFKETRAARGKEMVTELELTEHVVNQHARFVSDMGGTIWDTAFRFHPEGNPSGSATKLEIELESRPYKLLPKLLSPLVLIMVRKGMEKHIDSVKAYCESR